MRHFREKTGLLPPATRLALLDVDYRKVPDQLDAVLGNLPSALVLTGYSHRVEAITLERRASAHCAADKPDVAGFTPSDMVDQPALDTAVDLAALAQLLDREGIPSALSEDAGAYLCNFTYRLALERVTARQCGTPVLFVHVPAISGSALAETSAAALPLDTMARAIALIVAQLAP